MLVLTRKADEQILIGDDIKITLVRVRGNSVRLGIEAPRDVRIVRGELERLDGPAELVAEVEIDDRDQVFAHPQPDRREPVAAGQTGVNRLSKLMCDPEDHAPTSTDRSIFIGRIHRPEASDRLKNGPLSSFMSPR